jgi:hypothetical protein
MVYVDELVDRGWSLGPSSHLLADTKAELHAFARRIGLRRSWFQLRSSPHYDLTAGKRALAVSLGCVQLDRRQLVAKIRELRALGWP